MNENSEITNKMPSVVLILIMILSSFAALAPTQNAKAAGDESLTFVTTNFDLHYDVGEDIGFGFLVTNPDSSLNYEASWRVCDIWGDFAPDYSDWVDGDCIEYTGPDGNPVGGEIIVPAGVADGYIVVATIPGITSVDDGSGGVNDFDTFVVDQYVVAIMMTVSGVSIATANSTIFSVGDSGNMDVDLEIEGDIIEGQDYSFDWGADNLHQMGSVFYDLKWEVLDDMSVVEDSGGDAIGTTFSCAWSHYSHSCGRTPWIDGPDISGLMAGDYTLDAWLERDGVPIGTAASEYTHSFSVLAPPLTGFENVTISLIGAGHYQLGDTVEFDWGVTDMNDDPSVITYDFEWRVCKLANYGFSYSNDHSNWTDGACIEEIDTSQSPSLTNGGDEALDNSATGDSGSITTNPINLPRCDSYSYGCEYVIAGMVLVNGVAIASANSTIFSLDSVSTIEIHQLDRSGNITVGQDFSFSWFANRMHEKGSVAYDVQWEILDLATSPSSSTGHQGTTAISGLGWTGAKYHSDGRTQSHPVYGETVSGLSAGDYELRVWLQMDGIDDYSNAEDTHEFSVIDTPLTGNEAVQVSGLKSNYDIGEDVDIDIAISGLHPQTTPNYNLSWKVCKLSTGDFSGDYWGNYHVNHLINENWDLSDWIDMECGNTDWPFYMPEGAIDGEPSTMIYSGTYSYTLDGATTGLGPGEYVIAAILEVNGAIVAWDDDYDYFSVGTAAEVYVDLERSGNILADMDYNFDFGASDAFFMSDVDYEVIWVVRNDMTGVSAGFGNYVFSSMWDTGAQSASIPSAMLNFGDYTLYVWLERDGVADSSPEAEFEHSFRVINPALNTLATIDVQVDVNTIGWGQGTVVAYDLDNGQLFTMGWAVTDMMNNVIDSGEDTWIAPPNSKSWVLDFNHVTNGNYCLKVNLYAAQILVHMQNDCWTQASTADADSDGVLDADDMCPYAPVVANDANGDGCEDVDDTDGDGMDDDWENFYNTDPYVDDGAGDLDGDGVSNLDEFTNGTNPASSDTDEDFVNDGVDVCPLVWGDMANGCLTPINLPPICDIYFSLEMNGMVISGSAAIPAIPPMIPGGIGPQEIQVPAGTYYIIAVCTDPEGDMVTATINGVTIGPAATATVGAVINITENVEATVDVTVTWTDGVNTLTGAISITVAGGTNFVPDADGDGYTPGFTAAIGVMSLLGAAIAMRRRRL